MTYAYGCGILVEDEEWSNMNKELTMDHHTFGWYYGQTFIDSDKPHLLIEVIKPDGDLESFLIAPFNWMIA